MSHIKGFHLLGTREARIIGAMRENLNREYDLKFFDIGFSALAVRIPKISVHDFNELDSDSITATIRAFGDVSELKDAVVAYIIADDDYVEIDSERLYHEIMESGIPTDTTASLPVDEYPVDEPVSDAPTSLPVDEYPVDEPVSDAPTSLPVDKSPVNEPISDAPTSLPVDKSPVDEPVSDTTASLPVDKSPVDEPVSDTPTSLPVDKSPVDEPISDAPTSLPVDESLVDEPISDTPTSLPVVDYPVEDKLQSDVNSANDISDHFIKEKPDIYSEIESQINEEIEEDIKKAKVPPSASISEMTIKEPNAGEKTIEICKEKPLISIIHNNINLFEQIEKDIDSQDTGYIGTDEPIDTLTEIVTDIDSEIVLDTTSLPDIDYDHLVGEIESNIDIGADEMAKAKQKAEPESEEVNEEVILDESEMISRLVEEVSKIDDDEFKQITEANIRKGGEADEGAIKAVLDTFAKNRQKKIAVGKLTSGRRAEVLTKGKRGRYVKSRIPLGGEISDIAAAPTIRAAAIHAVNGKITVKNSDLREKVRRRRVATLLGIVVDASGSMSNTKKVEITKTVVLALLKDAYQRRDKVSLVTYAGRHAEVVLPFTSSVEMAKRHLENVQFGSTTPLAAGMLTGVRVLKSETAKEPSTIPIMILITDGTANVPLNLGGNIKREISQMCILIKNEGLRVLVIDISQNGSQFAKDVSSECMGQYFHPSSLSREALYCAIKKEQDIITNVASS